MPIDAFLFTGIAKVKKRERLAHLRDFLLKDNIYARNIKGIIDKDRAKFIIPIVELGSVLNKDSSARRVVIQGFRFDGGLDEKAALLAQRRGMEAA